MSSGCGEARWTSGPPGRSRSGPPGSCSWPTTRRRTVFAVDVGGPGPRGRVRAVRPGGRRRARRLVPRLRAWRHRHQGHGGPPAVPQRVPVGAARPRRRRPAGAGADQPPRRCHRRCPARRCALRRGGDRRRPRRRRRAARHHAPARRRGRGSPVRDDQDPPGAPADPHRDRHGHGLRGRGAARSPGCRTRSSPRRLRRIPFPFSDGVTGSSLEIFHVSHGKWETEAPIRAFVPYDGGREHPGQLHLHAGGALPARRPHGRRQDRRPDGRRARRR